MNGPFDRNSLTARTVLIGGVEKRVVTMADLNSRFAILETDGAASVYVSRRDFFPIQEADLKRRLASEVVETGERDGRAVHKPAFQCWTGHAERHVYRKIVFTGKPVSLDSLNLYRGLGVTPKPGNCDRIIAHVREVICSGDQRAGDAMLNLLAWQIQNIGAPSRTVVVLKSNRHQAGKGIFLGDVMSKIYGPSSFTASASDQLLGRFNDAVRGCVFAFLDEIVFAGDRRAADAIKSLSTTTEIGIETKGLPIVRCPVAINLWLASNHSNAAHVEESDARYWVLDVADHRIGDLEYFARLSAEIEAGGREAFAHYLLSRNVSNFVPWRDTPKDNSAKRAMIWISINPYDARKWLADCCETDQLIGYKNSAGEPWAAWHEGDTYSFAELANAYVQWQKAVRSPIGPAPTPRGGLGEVLTNAGLANKDSRTVRKRELPSSKTCLKNLMKGI